MFRKLLIALILCVVPIEIACARQPDEVSYHGETTLPEGKTSERIESIIDTVNSDAPERVRRFIEEECTEGSRSPRWNNTRPRSSGCPARPAASPFH